MFTALLNFYISGILLGGNPTPVPTPSPKTVTVLSASAVPQQNPRNIAPIIRARSAIAVDLKTGMTLFEKKSDDHLPIASITKLMTSIVILENHDINEVMMVSKKASQIEGSKAWLAPGEKITVGNLLYATLVHSANDAAYTLAENDSKSISVFVNKMNQRAQDLGLFNTHFTNPIGLDEAANYSSAYDLTVLGRYAYTKNFIRKASALKELEIASTNGKTIHKLKSTNDLLGSYLKVLGLKTGTTDQAGQCLVAIIENSKGNDILTVVLGSSSRYQETKVLADWVFRSFTWT